MGHVCRSGSENFAGSARTGRHTIHIGTRRAASRSPAQQIIIRCPAPSSSSPPQSATSRTSRFARCGRFGRWISSRPRTRGAPSKLLAHYEIRKPLVSLREHNEVRETPRLVGRLARRRVDRAGLRRRHARHLRSRALDSSELPGPPASESCQFPARARSRPRSRRPAGTRRVRVPRLSSATGLARERVVRRAGRRAPACRSSLRLHIGSREPWTTAEQYWSKDQLLYGESYQKYTKNLLNHQINAAIASGWRVHGRRCRLP